MSIQEELEKTYDEYAENYRACCIITKEIKHVLQGLTEKDKRKVLTAARLGWKKSLALVDVELAKQGEP